VRLVLRKTASPSTKTTSVYCAVDNDIITLFTKAQKEEN
jgi:hypothetical protein